MPAVAVCPSCGARYKVLSMAVEQVLDCRRCGARITVAASDEPSAPPAESAAGSNASASTPLHSTLSNPTSDTMSSHFPASTTPPDEPVYDGFADVSDRLRHMHWNAELLFTIGVVMLVFAYMLAVIDGAAVARAHAALAELELDFRDEKESLIGELTEAERSVLVAREALRAAENRRSTADRDAPGVVDESLLAAEKALTVAEQARSRKLAEVQQASRLYKLDRQRDIERNVLSQQIDSDANGYWYAWMQLPGFVCLFVGCIAFLKSESGVKRVTASIILAISLSVLVMLHLVPGALRSQSLFDFRGGRDVRFIEDE